MSGPHNMNPTNHHPSNNQNGTHPASNDREQRDRQRAILSIFTNVVEAGELSGPNREKKIEDSLALILDTPGLDDFFDTLLLDDLDNNSSIMEKAQEAMMFATDPYTGIIPDDYEFPPELQALIDSSPELQAYREELIADAEEEDNARWAVLAEDLQRRIDARFQELRDRVANRTWGEPPASSFHAPADGMLALITRSALSKEEPPLAQAIYSDEPTYRLGETRFRDDSGLIEVVLDIFKPGTLDPLVTSREDWRVFPMLDGEELPTMPAEDLPTTWKLADLISAEDLARVTYDVAILPPDEAPGSE